MPIQPRRPEILAPVGDIDALRAALAAGADAVYFGLADGFNARAKTLGIPTDALAARVEEIHRAGARAYLTLNTLIFEDELETIEALLPRIAEAGVDALIVQDPAVARLARAVAPTLELHASTQMTISTAAGARFAQRLGVTRIVVPRELSVEEIARLRAESDVELEVFIHGALCVSWSGQCLSSEAWGGRSANRGQCAQSCRMPYELIVDGEARPLGEVRYLLSPKDLAGARAVAPLAGLGVDSLKIEGRYKGPAYIITATQAYRRWAEAVTRAGGPTAEDEARLAEDLRDLEMVFSRGFSDGFLGGADHQHLVEGHFPKHRGALLGEVTRVTRRGVEVRHAERPWTGGAGLGEARVGPEGRRRVALPVLGGEAEVTPAPGMGVVFDAGDPEDKAEPGGPIFGARRRPDGWQLEFGRPGPDLRRVAPGQRVWITHDPQIERRTRKLREGKIGGRVPARMWARGRLGQPLEVTLSAGGREVIAATEQPLTEAQGAGLTTTLLEGKLGALGQTPFRLQGLSREGLPEGLHLPVSALKALRRRLVAELEAALAEGSAHRVEDRRPLARLRAATRRGAPGSTGAPLLIPLCRAAGHLEAAIAAGLEVVELDWIARGGLESAVEAARAAGLEVHVATSRVQKPGEEGLDRRLARLAPDGALIRHWGALMTLREIEGLALHGGASLNVTNSLTVSALLELGLESVTVPRGLSVERLEALMAWAPAERLTVTLHHHTPIFHTSHCIYAHTLSQGRDRASCGEPCATHKVALRDHVKRAHPVFVDALCRNTVYDARARSAAVDAPRLLEAGVRRFRVELLEEGAEGALRILSGYQALLRGHTTPKRLMRQLGVMG